MAHPDLNPSELPPAAAAFPSVGSFVEDGGVRFRVWAPKAERVTLVIESPSDAADQHELTPDGEDFVGFVDGLGAGARYRYVVDGDGPFPDPASRFQPEGVHGSSEVIDPAAYVWSDADWEGIAQRDLVFYELHVGTFTPEGTFAAAAAKLDRLVQLGVTAVELMPVHDFPGRWNWGYDPGAYFAPARAYGRPEDFRAFVDAAHAKGLAVFLDVVYNHLGPDGSYLPVYSDTVFSPRHETLWGTALNFDGPGSAGMRRFFVENALHWLDAYHIDGYRLDATFAIVDESETHILAELAQAVDALPGRERIVVAEDHRNLRSIVEPRAHGGMGLDAAWADDFHHQVRSALAGDDRGYYRDFTGSTEDLAETIRQGWFYVGQRSEHEGAPRGTPTTGLPRESFVVCISNHDQVGNRPHGDRLHHGISAAAYRAASALLLFVPQLPLLFQGQEWGASAPFQYFTDHGEELGRKVSEGRRKEFAAFGFDDVPDPQDPATFQRSQLDWAEIETPPHSMIWRWYRDLLALRRELAGDVEVSVAGEHGLTLHRGRQRLLLALTGDVILPKPDGMEVRLSSEDPLYAPDPQPPEIGGAPARSPFVPSRPAEAPEAEIPRPERVADDQVRFWRAGALLWEAG